MITQSPEPVTAIDRRAFLGTVGATAGALLATSFAPLAGAGTTAVALDQPSPASTVAAQADRDDEDWHVDDICGHRPPYAHPIPHAPARSSPVLWDQVDPVDRMLVI